MVRRSLGLFGIGAAILILGFLALFAVGGGGNPPVTGGFPTTTTIAASRSAETTSTTIVKLQGLIPNGTGKATLVYVTEPNVVGMTLRQAGPVLSAAGLSDEISTPTPAPAGTSSTGTILAQAPAAGSNVDQGQVIQLTVSGY